jgi:hypothetical protein
MTCGSRFSTSSSAPGRSRIVRLPTRAVPVPDTTYNHCSDHGCSLAESSLLSPPGANVIVAACEARDLASTANDRRRCFVVEIAFIGQYELPPSVEQACYSPVMSVEIHVACRRDPSSVAQIFASCRIARVEVGPARTIHAWSPRAHATLLLRERDVAGVVTFRSKHQSELVSEYAELVARAFEGVAVLDGEVVDLSQSGALSQTELASAWRTLAGRTERIIEERETDKRRRRASWERAQSKGEDRDYSTH